MRLLLTLLALASPLSISAQGCFDPGAHKTVETNRPDGRYISTYAVARAMLSRTTPRHAYRTGLTPREFNAWQDSVRQAMSVLMRHPDLKGRPAPKLLSREQKQGYIREKWEFYPLDECVATFIALIPDSIKAPVPAVLCIPGSGMAKEHLTGEISTRNPHTATALLHARKGYIAVAVDNAAAGEAADLEPLALSPYDYDTPARFLLEMGWSWLGYTSYLDRHVLEWMKTQPLIRRDRIVISGFSLGTEPMMVLGVLDPTVYAFIYNDFLCHTQERALAVTAPDSTGHRPFPNSIRHLVPGFWDYFNFPDIVASLAPRRLILTEGGLDRDLNLVRDAYTQSGRPEAVETHHYPKFADPDKRSTMETLPQGLTMQEYLRAVNVDPGNHYYKDQLVIPWLERILRQDETCNEKE